MAKKPAKSKVAKGPTKKSAKPQPVKATEAQATQHDFAKAKQHAVADLGETRRERIAKDRKEVYALAGALADAIGSSMSPDGNMVELKQLCQQYRLQYEQQQR